MRYWTICVLTMTALTGCATTEAVWDKPGGTAEQFYADRGECQARAFGASFPTAMQVALVFSGCMQGKGWYQEQRPRR